LARLLTVWTPQNSNSCLHYFQFLFRTGCTANAQPVRFFREGSGRFRLPPRPIFAMPIWQRKDSPFGGDQFEHEHAGEPVDIALRRPVT
jgi:hypothetical protein